MLMHDTILLQVSTSSEATEAKPHVIFGGKRKREIGFRKAVPI
jgi:hypothetical protein